MTNTSLVVHNGTTDAGQGLADAILGFIGNVPGSTERPGNNSVRRAHAIARSAATRAAFTAGGLALPPGPLGWLTIIPELIAVWKLQAQMVSDIAAVYGHTGTVEGQPAITREQMIYCLFRHTAAQAVRDLAVRVGERMLVQQVSLATMQTIAHKVGVHLTRHAIGKGVSRWLPVIGAVGVGAYAFYDTRHVAQTAIELFEHHEEIVVTDAGGEPA
jgi:hypothetical protein